MFLGVLTKGALTLLHNQTLLDNNTLLCTLHTSLGSILGEEEGGVGDLVDQSVIFYTGFRKQKTLNS